MIYSLFHGLKRPRSVFLTYAGLLNKSMCEPILALFYALSFRVTTDEADGSIELRRLLADGLTASANMHITDSVCISARDFGFRGVAHTQGSQWANSPGALSDP